MNVKERKKIKSNLYNIQVQAITKDCRNDFLSQKKYSDLKSIPAANGLVQELTEEDYPITPEYVNSFADSANYKKNLAQAISSPATGAYRDIRDLQEFASLDTAEQVKRVQEAQASLDKAKALINSTSAEKASQQSNNSEVDNGK